MPVSSLVSIQCDLQRSILDGDDTILASLAEGAKTRNSTLLQVYRNAYVMRLVDVVRSDHPMLHAYLGDAVFDDMARAYVAAHPSQHPNARWFSQHLARFLQANGPYADHVQIAELAAIECQLNLAFDAACGPRAARDGLSAVALDDWANLLLTPHPSARRLDVVSNAFAIWSALQRDATPPAPQHGIQPRPLLVWRSALTPRIRDMSLMEAQLWDAMAAGASFGRLCELLAEKVGPDVAPGNAAGQLAAWLDAGLIATARPPARTH